MSALQCTSCGAALPDSALFCGECGARVTGRSALPPPAMEAAAPVVEAPAGVPVLDEPRDLRAEPPPVATPDAAPAPSPPPARFVLQFSTGESVAVTGTGLIGRNPVAEPGEYFDHAVPIADPGKSVSKTHLEFGQDDGVFWVLDRFSGNGTVLREPGADPRYCEPGRRYRVSRGGRVDIGDQFFIVS